MLMSGISWPRYCTMGRPFDISILRASISSSRVISDSGTALGWVEPARNTSNEVASSAVSSTRSCAASTIIWEVTVEPIAWATPFGSMIMITAPSPRMVLPENIAM